MLALLQWRIPLVIRTTDEYPAQEAEPEKGLAWGAGRQRI
jgi:hypothetical protein